MKTIKLTKGRIAKVDNEDYEFLSQWKWYCRHKKVDGTYYACRHSSTINGKRTEIQMHRVIMDTPSNLEVDHIDHDGLNNQKANLRNVTQSQNQWNQKVRQKSRSGYKGVYWQKRDQRWRAQIRKNRQMFYLGNYIYKEQAAKAYNKAAKKLFGEFACLNEL